MRALPPAFDEKGSVEGSRITIRRQISGEGNQLGSAYSQGCTRHRSRPFAQGHIEQDVTLDYNQSENEDIMPRTHGNPYIGTITCKEDLPGAEEASSLLYKVADAVQPLMAKRGWRVGELVEAMLDNDWGRRQPFQSEGMAFIYNVTGRNYNNGYTIAIRLRFPKDPDRLMPFRHVLDVMMHELVHMELDSHDERFYALWDELRAEYGAPQLDWDRYRAALASQVPNERPSSEEAPTQRALPVTTYRGVQTRKYMVVQVGSVVAWDRLLG